MDAVTRTVRRAAFGAVALALAACASSKGPSPGATSPQAPNQCLAHGASCVADNDCCTLWCANGVCARKQP